MKLRHAMAGMAVLAVVVTAGFVPRWRLCNREIAALKREERLLRAVAERLALSRPEAAPRGEQAADMSREAEEFRRLADNWAQRIRRWEWSRWTPFLPHPRVEADSPLRNPEWLTKFIKDATGQRRQSPASGGVRARP